MKDCKCIDKVNQGLVDNGSNGMLYLPLMIQFDTGKTGASERVAVQVDQRETGRGKKKAPTLFATYCPFCGVKYPERA